MFPTRARACPDSPSFFSSVLESLLAGWLRRNMMPRASARAVSPGALCGFISVLSLLWRWALKSYFSTLIPCSIRLHRKVETLGPRNQYDRKYNVYIFVFLPLTFYPYIKDHIRVQYQTRFFSHCRGSEGGDSSASRQRSKEAMTPSRVSALILVGTASLRCRSNGLVDAAAAPLPSFPGYCSKNMSRNAIPSLAESLSSSFGDSVSADDVELLQVRCRWLSVVGCLGGARRGAYPAPSSSSQGVHCLCLLLCCLSV